MASAERRPTYLTGRRLQPDDLSLEQSYARPRPQPGPPEGDVLVDVELADGLLYLALENVGGAPAHHVRVRFDQGVKGLGGRRRIDRLSLFRRLEFLGPGRGIRTLVDRSASYFAREEPTRLELVVTWRTDGGERRSREIRHDLEVFRDLAFAEREGPSHGRPSR